MGTNILEPGSSVKYETVGGNLSILMATRLTRVLIHLLFKEKVAGTLCTTKCVAGKRNEHLRLNKEVHGVGGVFAVG